MNLDQLFAHATGKPDWAPYPYQRLLADEGLPDLLRAPTGAGKTMAAVLPWLYRRRYHPDLAVRAETPRWLMFVLPQRALVEQTADAIDGWLTALGETDRKTGVRQYTLMGGVDHQDREWKTEPERDAIFVGTQDMVLSRLLMRGYAEPRSAWPMSFGLLNAGVQFVFDEVQLMGPGLSTSLQLDALRELIGPAMACRSMWMSATLDTKRLPELAPDLRRELRTVELSDADRKDDRLRRRLDATRELAQVQVDGKRYGPQLAELAVDAHRAGTRTLLVLNTVPRAMQVFDALVKAIPRAETVLLHSRFRPGDRQTQTDAAIDVLGPDGTIVVSTQVLEAGMDITSDLLITELAPWSSIVQRAGRCNRDGEAKAARMLWTRPPVDRRWYLPYDEAELEHSATVLAGLEGELVTSGRLQDAAQDLDEAVHPVLRRKDLVELFDTTPDLANNDVDVSQWIRDADDRTVSVAWRRLADMPEDAQFPTRDELCPVPLDETRKLRAKQPSARVYDQVTGKWRPAVEADVRPSAVIVFDTTAGGYRADRGFDPAITDEVPVLPPTDGDPAEAVETDPLSLCESRWVPLAEHLADVGRETARLLDALDPPGVIAVQREAACLAGRYHDIGKAHPTFDASLRGASGDPGGPGPWAKSPGRGQLRHVPRYFRHELVSALLLLDPETGLLDGIAEADLVVYLALLHHGKVRLAARGKPDEPARTVLGVEEGGTTLAIELPDGRHLEPRTLSLHAVGMGDGGLTARALRLRDRADLGPFRLAFLEAVVRGADWVASAGYDRSAR